MSTDTLQALFGGGTDVPYIRVKSSRWHESLHDDVWPCSEQVAAMARAVLSVPDTHYRSCVLAGELRWSCRRDGVEIASAFDEFENMVRQSYSKTQVAK